MTKRDRELAPILMLIWVIATAIVASSIGAYLLSTQVGNNSNAIKKNASQIAANELAAKQAQAVAVQARKDALAAQQDAARQRQYAQQLAALLRALGVTPPPPPTPQTVPERSSSSSDPERTRPQRPVARTPHPSSAARRTTATPKPAPAPRPSSRPSSKPSPPSNCFVALCLPPIIAPSIGGLP